MLFGVLQGQNRLVSLQPSASRLTECRFGCWFFEGLGCGTGGPDLTTSSSGFHDATTGVFPKAKRQWCSAHARDQSPFAASAWIGAPYTPLKAYGPPSDCCTAVARGFGQHAEPFQLDGESRNRAHQRPVARAAMRMSSPIPNIS